MPSNSAEYMRAYRAKKRSQPFSEVRRRETPERRERIDAIKSDMTLAECQAEKQRLATDAERLKRAVAQLQRDLVLARVNKH